MTSEAGNLKESQVLHESDKQVVQREEKQEKVKTFIAEMRAVKFEGPRGKFDLDTFLLLTYDQRTKKDEIEFVSWAIDSSRSDPGYIKTLLGLLELPKRKDHPPFENKFTISNEGKKVSVIAFGTGPNGRSFLYRLKGMSTKESFKRLKKAAEIF